MPMIDLTYPEGALDPKARADAVEKLTHALVRIEGARVDSEHALAMCWTIVHELPAEAVNVAGRPATRPFYRVIITVPAGTLLQGPGPVGALSRRILVRETTEILLAAEGTEYRPEETLRVNCVVREVPDGYWGSYGTTVRMEDIVAIVDPTAGDTPLAADMREAAGELLAGQLGSLATSEP
jgi:phenylpyruvate tautomerase PptA (4-oxalocrotonate tautomerase family)